MKITNRCKLAFAVVACALPLAANAQNMPMASDSKMMNDGKMMSDNKMSDGKMDDKMMMPAMPKVGDMASDFTLKTLDDQSVRLSDLTAKSQVVLVVLRGWPGYQCPYCTKQAHDYVNNAEKLKAAGVQVVMVYPGPADDLKAHATEFLGNKEWPKDFLFVLDPDYSFTKSYGLRWNAPKETAYPSTFIISKEGKVTFAHVSKQHGDRVGSDAVLKALNAGMMKDDMAKPGM
jgi:thioredoxin-dependent peroxiredoxin